MLCDFVNQIIFFKFYVYMKCNIAKYAPNMRKKTQLNLQRMKEYFVF